MVFYVVIMVFALPTCILTPCLLKLSHMNSQFSLRKDFSTDFLDDDQDDEYSDENEEFIDDQKSEHSSYISDHQSLDQVEFEHRASKATLDFLKTDQNLPRTLFSLTISQLISWLPFFSIISVVVFFEVLPVTVSILSLGSLWWGYAQSPITPFLIYLLSDRVNFIISKSSREVKQSSLSKRIRRFTLTLTETEKV